MAKREVSFSTVQKQSSMIDTIYLLVKLVAYFVLLVLPGVVVFLWQDRYFSTRHLNPGSRRSMKIYKKEFHFAHPDLIEVQLDSTRLRLFQLFYNLRQTQIAENRLEELAPPGHREDDGNERQAWWFLSWMLLCSILYDLLFIQHMEAWVIIVGLPISFYFSVLRFPFHWRHRFYQEWIYATKAEIEGYLKDKDLIMIGPNSNFDTLPAGVFIDSSAQRWQGELEAYARAISPVPARVISESPDNETTVSSGDLFAGYYGTPDPSRRVNLFRDEDWVEGEPRWPVT